ncbi:MAG: TetR family transcriptional regulator [Methylocystaceae bacterium]|nr:MAG: TetR family transcriptional regulator [Methylocystaceae bacterium]KAF0209765.1 MAG: TetR family transcriptional [Methylocystaceae bacterium]TXT43127.1 MAG: TetR family transcriptional regulator [Methylocystaceae bacterium]
MDAEVSGRANQKRRTRKGLLEAASRLVKQGRKPSLEEIAEEALVSRATAYRYFPNVEALLAEASLDIAIPEPKDLLRDAPPADPVSRVQLVDTTLHDIILANEASLRIMLAHSLERAISEDPQDKRPVRQNRRMALIDAALTPARHRFRAGALNTLSKALALIIGTEGMIVIKDVLQLNDADARKVKRWAIRSLIEAAMKPARE